MTLWVPPGVSADRRLRDRTDRFNADVILRSRVDTVCERFNRELRQIDHRLEMRWFGDDTQLPGVHANRYALVRTPEIGPRTIIVIDGSEGEFAEPTSAVFTFLARCDWWNADARRDRERRQRLATEAAERQDKREEADRHEELKDRWNAKTRTWVSMNRDSAWAQNAAGLRRPTRGKR